MIVLSEASVESRRIEREVNVARSRKVLGAPRAGAWAAGADGRDATR